MKPMKASSLIHQVEPAASSWFKPWRKNVFPPACLIWLAARLAKLGIGARLLEVADVVKGKSN